MFTGQTARKGGNMIKFIVHVAWRADFIFDDINTAAEFAVTAAKRRYQDGERQDDDKITLTILMKEGDQSEYNS